MAVNGNNKSLPWESLSPVLSEKITKSTCSADLALRSKVLQAELQNLFCQQMSCGGSDPLLTFKPPYVWHLVAQKDQQGSAALAQSGAHQWATSHPAAAAAVPFFAQFCPLCRKCSGGNMPEPVWKVSDSSWASFILYISSVCMRTSEINGWAACNLNTAGPSGLVYDFLFLSIFSPVFPFCNKNVRDFTGIKIKAMTKVPFQSECEVFSLGWRSRSQPRKRIRMNWTLKV